MCWRRRVCTLHARARTHHWSRTLAALLQHLAAALGSQPKLCTMLCLARLQVRRRLAVLIYEYIARMLVPRHALMGQKKSETLTPAVALRVLFLAVVQYIVHAT